LNAFGEQQHNYVTAVTFDDVEILITGIRNLEYQPSRAVGDRGRRKPVDGSGAVDAAAMTITA
jgi:hypothetical protein